ncbi:hypothetical protein EXIGLDRAFT_721847 [Exidia glandulosa HHB12029]|uniref:Uncharacterized protein n=1 Tax=Exidia glandulosa HHB12029 TaxID=1314781 RepID=A0A165QIM6_EXIGL|nr:hypothetical protein EXIGLDRAFT_721847 [Exidia glandulosa HHB12029]
MPNPDSESSTTSSTARNVCSVNRLGLAPLRRTDTKVYHFRTGLDGTVHANALATLATPMPTAGPCRETVSTASRNTETAAAAEQARERARRLHERVHTNEDEELQERQAILFRQRPHPSHIAQNDHRTPDAYPASVAQEQEDDSDTVLQTVDGDSSRLYELAREPGVAVKRNCREDSESSTKRYKLDSGSPAECTTDEGELGPEPADQHAPGASILHAPTGNTSQVQSIEAFGSAPVATVDDGRDNEELPSLSPIAPGRARSSRPSIHRESPGPLRSACRPTRAVPTTPDAVGGTSLRKVSIDTKIEIILLRDEVNANSDQRDAVGTVLDATANTLVTDETKEQV